MSMSNWKCQQCVYTVLWWWQVNIDQWPIYPLCVCVYILTILRKKRNRFLVKHVIGLNWMQERGCVQWCKNWHQALCLRLCAASRRRALIFILDRREKPSMTRFYQDYFREWFISVNWRIQRTRRWRRLTTEKSKLIDLNAHIIFLLLLLVEFFSLVSKSYQIIRFLTFALFF